jgi:HK97 family phage portal protein
MSDYIDSLEFYLSNNMESKEQAKDLSNNVSNVSDEQFLKDFSSTWLKIKEKNLIQIGDNLVNPCQNSYLVYKCVTVISENICTVPIMLYDKNTKNPLPETSPLYNIFHEPNPYDNFDDFMSSISTFYTLYGEAFIAVIKETSKKFEMWVLDPRLMKEVLDKKTGMLLGWVYNKTQAFDLNEIIQIKKRNPYNQWRGLSPLVSASIELNIDYKSSKYQESLLANGAVPGGIIKVPENALVSDEEMKKMRRIWESRHMGAAKGHKVAVLKSGLTYEPIAFNGQEMEFIDSRKFTREAILLTFGVPSVVAGLTEGVNRTSAEAQLKLFWRTTIKPQLERICSKFNHDILPQYYPNVGVRFDYRKIDELQKDFTNDSEVAKKLFSMGFSRNELNYRFDLGFDEDSETGDIKYIPLNLVDASLKIYANEGPMGEGDDGGPDIHPDLPIPNQAKSINDIKIKILTPKMRNFFKDEKKRLVKLIATSDIQGKEILKEVKLFVEQEQDKFSKKFIPYFIEIVLAKQVENSGIDTIDMEQIELDKELFDVEFNKILAIFNLIFTKIASEMVNCIENREECIKIVKFVYSDLSKSLEDNLVRFNKQICIKS